MCGESFEDRILPYSVHRQRCYRIEMPTKAYIDERNLQIHVQEQPAPIEDHNKSILRKLFNYYHQKQWGEIAPQKKHLNKLEICQELTHIQDTYQQMMQVKMLLNSEYDSLVK